MERKKLKVEGEIFRKKIKISLSSKNFLLVLNLNFLKEVL